MIKSAFPLLLAIFVTSDLVARPQPPENSLARSEVADLFIEKVSAGMNQRALREIFYSFTKQISTSDQHLITALFGWLPLQYLSEDGVDSYTIIPPQSSKDPNKQILICASVKFDKVPARDILEKSAFIELLLGKRKGTILEFSVLYPVPPTKNAVIFYSGPNSEKNPLGPNPLGNGTMITYLE